MSKLTALGGGVRRARGAAAGAWDGEAGRRQRLIGRHHAGGEGRHLFGVGEGPAEAVAGAKQEIMSGGDSDERQDSRLDVLRKALPVFYQES